MRRVLVPVAGGFAGQRRRVGDDCAVKRNDVGFLQEKKYSDSGAAKRAAAVCAAAVKRGFYMGGRMQ